jgi:hypothetical protein
MFHHFCIPCEARSLILIELFVVLKGLAENKGLHINLAGEIYQK